MKGRIVFLLAHLRTLFTASFIALAIVACDGSSGEGASATGEQDSESNAETIPEPIRVEHQSAGGISSIYLLGRIEDNVHTNHIPITDISGEEEIGIRVSLRTDKPDDLIFYVIDEDGRDISIVDGDDYANDISSRYYIGFFENPRKPFRIKAASREFTNDSREIVLPHLYR